MSCRYVARSFAMIGARSSRYIVAFFSRRISELASSIAADSRAANLQTSNLQPNPHILTRHRSTAELRMVGIETSRPESLTEEPFSRVEQSSHAPSTHPRNDYQSLRWPSSFTQRVYSKKNEQLLYCCTPVITHEFWVHIGPIPWATSNRQTSQLALR